MSPVLLSWAGTSFPAQELKALSWHPYTTEAPRRSRSQVPSMCNQDLVPAPSRGCRDRGTVSPLKPARGASVPLHPLCSEENQESSAPVG